MEIVNRKKYTKKRLCEEAKITTNAMARMGRGEDVRLKTLVKICDILGCTLDDIVDLASDKGENEYD